MRKAIYVPTYNVAQSRIRAIVRGDLALHLALRYDGKIRNEWTVTYVPTGQAIVTVQGCRAGRIAFRSFAALSFQSIDNALIRRCNTVLTRLRKRHVTVLSPRTRFSSIIEVPA